MQHEHKFKNIFDTGVEARRDAADQSSPPIVRPHHYEDFLSRMRYVMSLVSMQRQGPSAAYASLNQCCHDLLLVQELQVVDVVCEARLYLSDTVFEVSLISPLSGTSVRRS